jgi:hypothetical protein
MFPLFVLAAAFGVSVFASRPLRYGVVALAVVLGFAGGVSNVHTNRTQAAQIASHIDANARPGDLVVYCPDSSAPDVHRVLPDWKGYREVTFPSLGGPQRVNWIDYEKRTREVSPLVFALKAIQRADDKAAKSHEIFFVWSSGLNGLRDKCERIADSLTTARPHPKRLVQPDLTIFEHAGLIRFYAS